jgi:hypothetical protein
MKKLGLFFSLIMLMSMTLYGQYVEVGNQETTIRYIPADGYYDYSWTRTIYLYSDLLQEMTINKISYNVSNDINSFAMNNQSIYMRHTSASEYSSTDYIDPSTDDSFQLVFSGNVILETGWNDYDLDVTFDYNGNDNLEVVYINNDGSYQSGYPNFYGRNSDANRTLYKYRDGTFPNMSGSYKTFFPNTRFNILNDSLPGIPTIIEPGMGAVNVAINTNFIWNNGVNTSYVVLYIADNELFYDALIVNPASSPYYYPDTEYNSQYYWKLVAFSPQGQSSSTQTYTFYSDYGIAQLPYEENFDSYQEEDKVNGWIVLDDTGNSYNYCQVDYGQAFSAPSSLRLHNSGTTSGNYILSSPKIENAGNRVSFSIIGEDNFPIEVVLGTMSDASDESTFSALGVISLTNEFVDYSYNLPNDREIKHISFKHSLLSQYQNIYIDDFLIEEIPENEPSVVNLISPEDQATDVSVNTLLEWEIGENTSGINLYLSSNLEDVENLENSALVITNDLLSTYECQNLEHNTNYYWRLSALNNISGIVVHSDVRQFTTELPDNQVSITIGDGQLTNTSLPIDSYFGYTYSQTIYYPEQINVSGDIVSLSIHYNGNSTWGPDDLNIYMGHTQESNFQNTTSWIPYDELTQVYAGSMSVTSQDQWLTFNLDTPFHYNNADNLVIAWDENTQGYHSSNDQFYNTSTINTRSLVYKSDSTNPDPQNPPAGQTKSAFPNINLLLAQSDEIYPSLPIVISPANNEINYELEYPLEWTNGVNTDYINLIVGNSADLTDAETFTNVQSPFFFEHQYNTTYYWKLQAFSSSGNSTESQIFKYTTDYGFAQIPFIQNFDSYSEGDHPNGWYVLDNTGNSYNYCQVDYGRAYSAPAALRLHNSGTTSGDYILSSPRFVTQGNRVSFSIIGQDNLPIEVVIGTMDNPNNADSFTAIDTLSVSEEFHNYTYSFSEDYSIKYFSFKHSMLSQYQSIYIDDFTILEIPENEPSQVTLISPEDNATNVSVDTILEWEIGDNTTGVNVYFSSNLQDVEDMNPSAMVIENQLISSYECSDLENSTSYFWRVSAVNNLSGLVIDSDIRQFTTELRGNLVSITIGDEELTNIGLPIEPYFGYTYSQTIYQADQINHEGSIVSLKIHYNGNSAWGPEDLNIYMGHTQLASFESQTSWVPLANLTQVYAGTITTTNQDEWLTFDLDIPFNYNNTDNLLIAWDENTNGYHASSDEFFNSSSINTVSIQYRNDTTNPDPANPPSGTLISAYPNIEIILDSTEPVDEYLPPRNLIGIADNGSVQLSWNSPLRLNETSHIPLGYYVYRNSIQITESVISDTLYSDADIEVGNIYSYYVTALYDEEESQASNVVEIEITNDYPAPTNLIAQVDYPNINLTWDEFIESSTEEIKWTDENWQYFANGENTFAILAENTSSSNMQINTVGFVLYGTLTNNYIDVKVWSDDNGLPGDELYSLATTINQIHPDWCNIDVSDQNWTVPANTNVFIGIANYENSSNFGLLMETTSSPANSFTYVNEQWESTLDAYSCSNVALRAEVETGSSSGIIPDSYSVYRSADNDTYYLIASVFEGNYQDNSPIFNTQSYYYVTGVYGDIESFPSNIAQVEINELILPGQGSQESPYLINDIDDLYILTNNNEYWGQGIYIEQTADIDAEASQYVQGSGFSPIGYEWGNFFRGNYNGNNHTISNYYINLPQAEYVGIFGYTYGATISNLHVSDIQVYGHEKVGGLVGRTYANTLIENCSVTGIITGTESSNTMVGGLVGNNYESTINNCYTQTILNGSYIVGGLVGYNISSTISNSFALENIDCSGHFVGGLVGYSQSGASIENSYASCNVHGVENVGGLVGFNDGSHVLKSYSQGQISSIGAYTGGLVAKNMAGSTITQSYSSANVNGAGSYGGGLVADNNGSISDSYASGNIQCLDDYVGGLVGLSSESGQIVNCYSTGNVSGSNSIGAFIGFNNGSIISNSLWNNETCDIELGAGGNTGNLSNFAGISSLEFLDQANFIDLGWDFQGESANGSQDIWTFSSGHYPYLSWEDKFVAQFTVSQQTISANS